MREIAFGEPVVGSVARTPSEILEAQGRRLATSDPPESWGGDEDLEEWGEKFAEEVRSQLREGEIVCVRFQHKDLGTESAALAFGADPWPVINMLTHFEFMDQYRWYGAWAMDQIELLSQISNPEMRALFDNPALVYPYPTENPTP